MGYRLGFETLSAVSRSDSCANHRQRSQEALKQIGGSLSAGRSEFVKVGRPFAQITVQRGQRLSTHAAVSVMQKLSLFP